MAIGEIDFIVYVTALILLLTCYAIFGTYFMRKYYVLNKEKVEKKKDKLPLTYGLAFIFMGLGRFFLAIFDVITEFDSNNYDVSNFYIWKVGSALQIVGIAFFFVLMEKRIMKGRDKYVLVLLYTLFIVIGLAMLDIEFATTFVVIGMMFAVYIPIAYLYIAMISDGVVRKKGLIIFFGFIITIIGSFLPGEQILVMITQATGIARIQVHIIAFFVIMLGMYLVFNGTK